MKRIGGITKERLEELYVEKGFGLVKCAEILSTNPTTIKTRLIEYNIHSRSYKEAAILCHQQDEKHKIKGITKEKLIDIYVKKKHSLPQCANILGVSVKTICNRLDDYNITRRSIQEANLLQRPVTITKERLIELYVEKRLSANRCAEILDVNHTTIFNYLKRENIPIRKRQRDDITKAVLEDLYVKKELSAAKCGERFGVCSATIFTYLKKHGIAIRHKDTYKRYNIKKETLEELYVDRGLSLEECANILGVTNHTILNKLKKCGIHTRTPKEVNDLLGNHITKEIIEELYIKKKLSIKRCCEIIGCGRLTIEKRLGIFNIQKRAGPNTDHITKDKLMELYLEKEMCIADCSISLGCSSKIVYTRLIKFGIPLRSWVEAKHVSKYKVKPKFDIEKNVLEELYLLKKFSARMCGESLGINLQTVLNKLRMYNVPIRSLSEAHQVAYEEGRRKNIVPNKAEATLFSFIKEACPDEYKYTGDGTLWIGGLNPDFSHCGDKKKLIELFGGYWHEGEVVKTRGWKATEFGRKAVFSQLGYDTLIIGDKELKNKEKVIKKLKEFNSQ